MERPAEYVEAAHAAVTRQPSLYPLVSFLGTSLPDFVADVATMDCSRIKCNVSTQTQVHVVEKHIDHRCVCAVALLVQTSSTQRKRQA
jgi:hypothetical protein